jgi:hypothetical protein
LWVFWMARNVSGITSFCLTSIPGSTKSSMSVKSSSYKKKILVILHQSNWGYPQVGCPAQGADAEPPGACVALGRRGPDIGTAQQSRAEWCQHGGSHPEVLGSVKDDKQVSD